MPATAAVGEPDPELLQGLARLLASGVDPARGLTVLAGRAGRATRRPLQRAAARVRQGEPLARTLAGIPAAGPRRRGAVAGSLETEGERQAELAAEWLPRLAYAAVVVWLATGLLAGALPLP